MQNPLPCARRRSARIHAGRISALALLAGLGAGCSSDAVRLNEPIVTGSTPNQQRIITAQADAAPAADLPAVPAQPVVAQPLSPVGQQQVALAGETGTLDAPKPYTPPTPYAAKGLVAPVGVVGSVEEMPAAAPEEVTVARHDAPPEKPAARPSIGRKAAPELADAPTGARVHKVRAGDSLWSLAQTYGVSQDALVRANALADGSIRPGQVLTIPDGKPVQVAAVQPKGDVVTDVPVLVAPDPVEEKAAEETPAEPAPTVAKKAPAQEPAAEERGSADSGPGFRWPVRGKVIAGFGKKANGERNDGINLAVPEGTSVKAAEDGEVIYAGNELKNYGNLVLIRHSNGFVSAYAHNKSLDVKRGDKIRRGQIIAKSGMSGGVGSPQVHFELRRGATPVNPLDHLSDG